MKLLVKGIGQLVTVTEGKRFLAGADMANITLREGCLALAVDNEGRIAMIGSEAEVMNTFSEESFGRVIDAEGAAVNVPMPEEGPVPAPTEEEPPE